MWTKASRCHYERSRRRYPSDSADEERALVPLAPAKGRSSKRTIGMLKVINGLTDVLSAARSDGKVATSPFRIVSALLIVAPRR
jgi:hypothetical protein